MIKLPIEESRLLGLKVSFVGLLIFFLGFALTFLPIDSIGWFLVVVGLLIAAGGGAYHFLMVFAHMGDLVRKRKPRNGETPQTQDSEQK